MIVYNKGTNFDSNKFKLKASAMTIRTKAVLVEAHHLVGIVERYYRPLRRAYEIITSELKSDICPKEIRLQMAVKAINDTAGYDGLVPTLLVFGAYLRISNSDAPTLLIARRAYAIKSAMNIVSKLYAAY
jgi:hypothetical protein